MPRAWPVAAVAVCSFALAACGSSPGPSGSSTASGSASALTQGVRFAQCMRSNGVPSWPDPSSGDGHAQALNRVDANSPAFQRAYAACRKGVPSGQPGPPAPTGAQLRFALSFARCLRTHGFPQFPDPLTTYGPGFTLARGEYFPDDGAYRPQSAGFRRAAKACGVRLPQLPPLP